MSPYDERDTAEIRMMRAITELNHRDGVLKMGLVREALSQLPEGLRRRCAVPLLSSQSTPAISSHRASRDRTQYLCPLRKLGVGPASPAARSDGMEADG